MHMHVLVTFVLALCCIQQSVMGLSCYGCYSYTKREETSVLQQDQSYYWQECEDAVDSVMVLQDCAPNSYCITFRGSVNITDNGEWTVYRGTRRECVAQTATTGGTVTMDCIDASPFNDLFGISSRQGKSWEIEGNVCFCDTDLCNGAPSVCTGA